MQTFFVLKNMQVQIMYFFEKHFLVVKKHYLREKNKISRRKKKIEKIRKRHKLSRIGQYRIFCEINFREFRQNSRNLRKYLLLKYINKMNNILNDTTKFSKITFDKRNKELDYLLDREEQITTFLNKGVLSELEFKKTNLVVVSLIFSMDYVLFRFCTKR